MSFARRGDSPTLPHVAIAHAQFETIHAFTDGNGRRYVAPLVAAGVIGEFTDRARNRAWRAPEVLGALDAFAELAGRCTLAM